MSGADDLPDDLPDGLPDGLPDDLPDDLPDAFHLGERRELWRARLPFLGLVNALSAPAIEPWCSWKACDTSHVRKWCSSKACDTSAEVASRGAFKATEQHAPREADWLVARARRG